MSYQIIDDTDFTETVTLAEVKNFSRIDADYTAFDDELTLLISAARQRIEAYLNIGLVQRSITVQWAGYPLELPLSPTGDITSVTGKGGAIAEADYTVSNYQAKRIAINSVSGGSIEWFYHDGYVEPWTWNAAACNEMYSVTYLTGHDELPKALKNAWLSEVDYLFKMRGMPDLDQISQTAAVLVSSYSRNPIL